MPVTDLSERANRRLHTGARSWSGQRPDGHDPPSSRSNESANSALYYQQESFVHTTYFHYSSYTPSPRLYGRPVDRAHHLGQGIPQDHSYAGTTGRLHPSRSPSSLQGTQSEGETVTEAKSAGRYECEYCSKRFKRPSDLKVWSSSIIHTEGTEHISPESRKHTYRGATWVPQSLRALPSSRLIITLCLLLQLFSVLFQTAVVASVSCQTCVTMHESIQMPWSIHRRKEKGHTKPVLQALIPTPSDRRRHFRLAQDGEPVAHAGAYPVVGVPVHSLGRDLRLILIWKWPKKRGRHLQPSHVPTPVDPPHSQPIAEIPPYGASSIPHMGSAHPSMPVIGPSSRSHPGGYATQPRHPVRVQRKKPQSSDSG